MIVKNLMKEAIVVDKDIKLSKAAKIMSSRGISSLIRIKKNKVMGIITEKDLVRNFGKDKKISKIMGKKIIIAYPEDKATETINLMKNNKINILPVVNKKNKLLGIVSLEDLLYKACQKGEFLFD